MQHGHKKYPNQNNLFPVFLQLEKLKILLIGGGNVGVEKLSAIIRNSPETKVHVIALEIDERIKGMQNMLNMENKNIDSLRYQLFTGTVGTINECKKYNNIDGLFLILQIMPKRNENEKISSNLSDIKSFLNENNAETLYEDEKSLLSKIHSKEQNINMYLGYLRIKEA